MASDLKKLKSFLEIVLISYFLMGIGMQLSFGRELFPIFSWFLFSRTPNRAVNFTIIIYTHNGRELTPPISFHKAPKSIADSESINANSVIKKLGNSVLQGSESQIIKNRKILERNYMYGNIEYALIKETYDPIQKWKYNEADQEVLSRFESGEFQ